MSISYVYAPKVPLVSYMQPITLFEFELEHSAICEVRYSSHSSAYWLLITGIDKNGNDWRTTIDFKNNQIDQVDWKTADCYSNIAMFKLSDKDRSEIDAMLVRLKSLQAFL